MFPNGMSVACWWHRCFLKSLPFVFTTFLLTAEKEQVSKGSSFFSAAPRSLAPYPDLVSLQNWPGN